MDTDIYPILLLQIYDSEINLHYLRRYIKLIRYYKSIEPAKRPKYYEEHHIFPNNQCSKKFSKDMNNLALLPLKAHFVVHHLLWKAFPKNKAMIWAFNQMSGRTDFRISARVYERLKKELCEVQSESNKTRIANGTHNFLGPDSNAKRVANGTHPLLGGEIARETQRKRAANGTHHFLGGDIQRESAKERIANGTHHFLEKGMTTVLDIEQQKFRRISTEEFQSSKGVRYFGINSKVAKEFKTSKAL